MAEHGLVARQPLEGDWTPGSGYRIGAALTQREPGFTALFVANDQMSLGCIHALLWYHQRGAQLGPLALVADSEQQQDQEWPQQQAQDQLRLAAQLINFFAEKRQQTNKWLKHILLPPAP